MKKSASTRLTILEKAFELIYMHGYQATSVDDIIATTQVTKGAFYYHFKNKDEMGLAVINEVMFPAMQEGFVALLENSDDPVQDIYAVIENLLMHNPFLQVQYGCPAGNMTQEMSPLNAVFSDALAKLVHQWENLFQKSLANGKKAGKIREDVNEQQVIFFVMSGYWGIRNFGKLYNDKACYVAFLLELKRYLEGLQAVPNN